MPLGITKRQIDRTAFNAVHNPPNPTDNIKASKSMGMEKNRMARELAPFLMYLYKKYLKATILEGTDLDMLKLINKAMRQMPGSPNQKKTLEKLNAMRKSVGMKPIGEGSNDPKHTDTEPKPASVYGFQSPVDTKKELDKEVDTDKIPGGLAKGMSLRDIADHHGVDFEQMKEYAKLGVKTELEHTTDSEIAYEITKDHLYEDPKYYIKLSKIEEDLRNWFGKGKTGSTDGGGWDRYGSDGQKLGKCGDGDEGDAYAACLSKEKAAKLGPKGRASFVRRKRADQKKAGDTKKGGNKTKGKTPTFSKTKANEDISIPINIGDTILGGKFKNKRIVVKSIGKNEKGDITINGKPLLKYRLLDESTLNEFGGTLFHLVGFDSNNKPVQKIIKRASDSFMKDVAKYGSEKLFKSGKNVDYVEIYYDNNHLATVKDSGRKIVKEKGWGKLPINEIPMGDLQKIDQFADKKLNPVDVVLTDKHFFDRLNDPRNGKEISQAELIGFFKRLSKKRKEFVEFLNQYNSLVAVDDRTNINIPFMKQANKAIAKTIMRKKDFKTPDKKLDI